MQQAQCDAVKPFLAPQVTMEGAACDLPKAAGLAREGPFDNRRTKQLGGGLLLNTHLNQ